MESVLSTKTHPVVLIAAALLLASTSFASDGRGSGDGGDGPDPGTATSLYARFVVDPALTGGAVNLSGEEFLRLDEPRDLNRWNAAAWAVLTDSAQRGALLELESKELLLQQDAVHALYELHFVSEAEARDVSADLPSAALLYAEVEWDHMPTPLQMDPFFDQQWSLDHADIPEAWDLPATPGSEVVIAITDRGFQPDHPDLVDVWWENPGENGLDANGQDRASNGIDDDGNGYIDDHHGFLGDTIDVSSWGDHGTRVSGLAAAASNNGIGVASPNNGVTRLMALPMYAFNHGGPAASNFDAIEYAMLHGADVMSISWGNGSWTIRDLLWAAIDGGMVVAAAAGNSNNPIILAPARWDRVISVGSIVRCNERWGNSNYGPDIDIFAPGAGVWTTTQGSNYGGCGGTSCASPFIAGTAALLLAQTPDLTPAEVQAFLQEGAYDIEFQNPGEEGLLGPGAVDACKSLALSLGESDCPRMRCEDGPVADYGWAFPAAEGEQDIYFVADDGPAEDRLSVLDPTTHDIEVVDGSPDDVEFVVTQGDLVYFVGDDDSAGTELFSYDPVDGTIGLVADIDPGSSDSDPEWLTFGPDGRLYFTADDGEVGRELWAHDPLDDTTVLVGDFRPGSSSSDPEHLAWLGATLFMRAKVSGAIGEELYSWRLDDTFELVADIRPGSSSSSPQGLLAARGSLYFGAQDPELGRELFVHEPGSGITTMVADIHEGSGSGIRSEFTTDHIVEDEDGVLFFVADEPVFGEEIWRHDPGSGVVELELDLDPDESDADIHELTFGTCGDLFFAGETTIDGDELWRLDTESGNLTVAHHREGSDDSDPEALIVSGDTIYFMAESDDEDETVRCVVP